MPFRHSSLRSGSPKWTGSPGQLLPNSHVGELPDRIAEAVHQQAVVARARDHSCAAVDQLLCGIRAASWHPPIITRLGTGIRHLVDSALHLRMIELEWDAVARRQIGAADEQQ